jgi:hypothetical protein
MRLRLCAGTPFDPVMGRHIRWSDRRDRTHAWRHGNLSMPGRRGIWSAPGYPEAAAGLSWPPMRCHRS